MECYTCGSSDSLKQSSHSHDDKLYCWLCRFKFNRERDPTKFELDHHNGITHAIGCKVCIPQTPESRILLIMASPSDYVKETSGYPGECSGYLLAWLAKQLRGNINDIAYIESPNFFGSSLCYEFIPQDFNFKFSAPYGQIDEIEDNIVRFIMKDGSHYSVVNSDGEHQTYLQYHAPLAKNISLRTGLGTKLRSTNKY